MAAMQFNESRTLLPSSYELDECVFTTAGLALLLVPCLQRMGLKPTHKGLVSISTLEG